MTSIPPSSPEPGDAPPELPIPSPAEEALRQRLATAEEALRGLRRRLATLEEERIGISRALADANRQVAILEGSLTFRLARAPRALYRLLRRRRSAP